MRNMKQSLKSRLLRYIVAQPDFIASGELQRIVAEKTTYTPQNVGRRLRELTEEGAIAVEYRKGHAWYGKPRETLNNVPSTRYITGKELSLIKQKMEIYWQSIPYQH